MTSAEEEELSRLIAIKPNSLEPWIRCIAHFIAQNNYEKAKETVEKALKVINFKDDEELYNVWVVYLNLEVAFGTEDSLKDVFEKACGATNSLRIHKHLVKALKNNSKQQEATEVCESMLKKFRHEDLEVWYVYGAHLMETGEVEKSRNLLQRALQSLKRKNHAAIITRFAQLEKRYGDAQRARTMLEKVSFYVANPDQIGNVQKFF